MPITVSFRLSHGGSAYSARRDVDWPSVPRPGDQVEESWPEYGYRSVESVTWNLEGGGSVYLGEVEITEAMQDASPFEGEQDVMEHWKRILTSDGWELQPVPPALL